mgnify:CR=1 FL=1
MDNFKNFDTTAIHAGEEENKPKNALNEPIFMTSTFTFDNLEHAKKTFSFETDDYVYTRGNNPTLKTFEKKMAALEEGAGGVAFASGMAAITSTLLSAAESGEEILSHRVIYGSTHNVMKKVLPENGIKTKFIDLTDISQIKASLSKNTAAIYIETPANPNLDIIDIKQINQITEEFNLKIIVDNTFATPYFQKPLKNGADIVVHSATKYISGHGDVVAGIVVANDKDYLHRLKFDYMTEYGGVLSPFNAWLLLRGLKTLGLRMRTHEGNALKVAGFLEDHSAVKKVYYPGLDNFSGYEIANSQMSGYGAVLSFELNGDLKRAEKFVDSLKMIKLAVSLGDAETLIEYPFAMTHRGYSETELKQLGLNKKMIRLSVGLEGYEDIISDIKQALNVEG